MINVKKVKITKEIEETESVTCDRCKTTYDVDDWMEIQEFHHIHFSGGYGSVFGDESVVKADICQNCLKGMIGDFCRYNEDDNNEDVADPCVVDSFSSRICEWGTKSCVVQHFDDEGENEGGNEGGKRRGKKLA